MKIEVSNGELVDKWTILTIKLERIDEETALENVKKEHILLEETIIQLDVESELIKQLLEVNIALWDVEDSLREAERAGVFDDKFTEMARSIYLLNDDRAAIKRKINESTNSLLVEEKSYTPYEEKQ